MEIDLVYFVKLWYLQTTTWTHLGDLVLLHKYSYCIDNLTVTEQLVFLLFVFVNDAVAFTIITGRANCYTQVDKQYCINSQFVLQLPHEIYTYIFIVQWRISQTGDRYDTWMRKCHVISVGCIREYDIGRWKYLCCFILCFAVFQHVFFLRVPLPGV